MDGLFDLVKLVKVQYLLLLGDRQIWHLCRVMGRGRVGCARRCAWPWTLRYRATSAFARSLGVRACGVLGAVLCANRLCSLGCGALRVRAVS